jgi:chaperonin GroES|tara:strand:+ start:115 stop:432 length:318 start_codon:yes stop_codon:yes gene_type:complete
MTELPTIKPVLDRLLVERIKESEVTPEGIYDPNANKDKPQLGKVLDVGPGVTDDNGKLVPNCAKAGEVVLFGKYSYSDVTVGGKEYLMLRNDEVWGIVENYEGGE